ncbi:hypothetical protein K493DRAFT_311508 [Basidiobolus meristosporus CBS 931.73]|uniref:F-box domain-containing protein n=1 Tax=Basidiobolus meristosporus CBS 931.73 TaxID=1314790 RepID=A0A1Y1Z1B7_9FUNG|nr:hypothetical protein K493DRAFT_311508 [Basidiobolus meristosporus CBS 931.73]|eukprot:ORY04082.1 hypothetical protein K493DRAFT_311508 [Basidiobolus meristosporus CBS 931.73]
MSLPPTCHLLLLPVDVQIVILQNLDRPTLLSLFKVSPSLWEVAHHVLKRRLVVAPLRVSLIFHQANSWRFSAEFECKSCDPKTAELQFYPSQRVSVRYFHLSNKDAFVPVKTENQEFLTPNLLKESKKYELFNSETSLSVRPRVPRKSPWRLTYTVTKKAFISFVPKICINGQWLTPQEFVCTPDFLFQQQRNFKRILQNQSKLLLQKLWKQSPEKPVVNHSSRYIREL